MSAITPLIQNIKPLQDNAVYGIGNAYGRIGRPTESSREFNAIRSAGENTVTYLRALTNAVETLNRRQQIIAAATPGLVEKINAERVDLFA